MEYLINGTTLTSLANAIRTKKNISNTLTPEQMISEIESIAVLDMGTYTPSSTISSGFEIQHSLGCVPDFVVFMVTGNTTVSSYAGSLIDSVFWGEKFILNSDQAYGLYVAATVSNSIIIATSVQTKATVVRDSEISNGDYKLPTSTTFYIRSNSAAKLNSGITYRWIVGAIS